MGDERVIHFEVVGRDAPALQQFYSSLFGWEFDTNNPGGYGMTDHEKTGVVVGVGATPDGSQDTSRATSRFRTSTRRWRGRPNSAARSSCRSSARVRGRRSASSPTRRDT